MVTQSALGGSTISGGWNSNGPKSIGMGGEQGGRRGGLGVYYQTRGREESVKGEVTDFVATAPLEQEEAPAVSHNSDGPVSIRYGLSKLVLSIPMDTLKEQMEEQKARDAHIYVFPYWVKEMAVLNEKFESVGEDLVGWWAKAEWQKGLAEKLRLREIFEPEGHKATESGSLDGEHIEEEIDLKAMSTTKAGAGTSRDALSDDPSEAVQFASRVKRSGTDLSTAPPEPSKGKLTVPPLLAYVHSSLPSAPLVRRVDTSALLLSVSLRLAKLESIEEVGRTAASPFAHSQKVAYPAGVAQRCTVTKADCLLADNVTVEEKCVIKESVIGANCHIASGARLTRCLIMDGAVIGERCQLTGCIVGRRSQIGRESVLKDCEIQDGNIVPEETDAKNEKFMVFEGLDDEDGEGMEVSEEFDDSNDELGF